MHGEVIHDYYYSILSVTLAQVNIFYTNIGLKCKSLILFVH